MNAEVLRKARRLGDVLETTTSDATGSFTFEQATDSPYVTARHPGMLPLRMTRTEENGVHVVSLVMTPRGSLAVTCLGPGRVPIEDAQAWLHPEPTWVMRHSMPSRSERPGRIVFDDVWSGIPLRLNMKVTGVGLQTRMQWDRRLVSDDALRGLPIVVSPGETLELILSFEDVLVIQGTVHHPDGSPVRTAWVAARDLARPPHELAAEVEVYSDERGRYELHVPNKSALEQLRLVGARRRRGGWGGWQHALEGAVRTIDAASAVNGVLEVDLYLEPLLSIRGRVVGPEGAAWGSMVSAVPAGAKSPRELDLLGLDHLHYAYRRWPVREGEQDEEFELHGLLPGAYDLYASYDLPNSVQRFPLGGSVLRGVEAGRDDVVLTISKPNDVRLRVRSRAEGIAIDHMTVTTARFFGDVPSEAVRTLPKGAIDDVTLWVEDIPVQREGVSTRSGPLGDRTCFFQTIQGTELELQPMQAGWFMVGVTPYAKGEALASVSTGVVYLSEGDYELDFVSVPQGAIRGHVSPLSRGERLAVSVVDIRGVALPTGEPFGRHLRTVHRVEPNGDFELAPVPAGDWRVRFGTFAELREGRARRELEVRVRRGETLQVLERGL